MRLCDLSSHPLLLLLLLLLCDLSSHPAHLLLDNGAKGNRIKGCISSCNETRAAEAEAEVEAEAKTESEAEQQKRH